MGSSSVFVSRVFPVSQAVAVYGVSAAASPPWIKTEHEFTAPTPGPQALPSPRALTCGTSPARAPRGRRRGPRRPCQQRVDSPGQGVAWGLCMAGCVGRGAAALREEGEEGGGGRRGRQTGPPH